MAPPFSCKRLLLKLSGEALSGDQPFGISREACLTMAQAIRRLQSAGLEIGLVIGGGNIFRGIDLDLKGIPRTSADHMGMLATLMNGIALQETLIGLGVKAYLMSALECPTISESYHWRRAIDYLQEKSVVIFVGGTGNPYFTTDTAAALRASEIGADVLLKATKVDGVYDKDPLKYTEAKRYQSLSYGQVLEENLKVMDATAIALCRDNQIPIFVFHMQYLLEMTPEDLLKFKNGTLVSN